MPNPGFIRGGGSPRGQLAGVLGEALGMGLGELTGQYFANKSLEGVLNDETLKDAPMSERAGKLESALRPYGKRGESILQKRLQIEQQAEQEFASSLIPKLQRGEELTEKEASRLPPSMQLEYIKIKEKKSEAKKSEQAKGSLINALTKANVPQEEIDVFSEMYDAAPEGGKTEIIKTVNDLMRRGKLGDFQKKETAPIDDSEDQYYDFPEITQESGLTESERVRRYDSREKRNSPIYDNVYKSLKGLEEESRSLERLQSLEDSGKLPVGMEKWNINPKTGELLLPATASPESQLYVKTINDFITKAKEIFPGRVTNFDLEAFMKRLPQLSNSPEGRKLILKQMELTNKIAFLRDEALKETYDHYGVGEISSVEAKKIANKIYKERKPELETRLRDLDGMLDQTASNAPQEGSKIRVKNKLTGKVGLINPVEGWEEKFERA